MGGILENERFMPPARETLFLQVKRLNYGRLPQKKGGLRHIFLVY